jgi:hypothetical protein
MKQRRSISHRAQHLRRLLMAIAAESNEARGGHRCLRDRHAIALFQVAPQPTGRDPRMPARILASDQERQLECFSEADPADLLRRRLGNDQVPALERSAKDWVGAGPARSTLLLSGAGRSIGANREFGATVPAATPAAPAHPADYRTTATLNLNM